MEEGPEPQELMEQVEHSHEMSEEEREERKEKSAFTNRSAVLASSLAVLAAVASLLSGHAANEAILKQSEATDQWSYFQAKSTKAHIYEGNKLILETLAKADKSIVAEAITETLARFDQKSKEESNEKEKIKEDAETLETQSTLCFAKHQNYSYGVACFQIGIVLASISILVRNKYLFGGSIGAGVIGVIFSIIAIAMAG